MTKLSFKNFDWKKLLIGAKRPAIAVIATLIALLAVKPQWAWVAGISAERVWATVEFYCKK